MTERQNSKNLVENRSLEEESRIERGSKALEKIFLLLQEDAEKHDKSVTGFVRSVPIPMRIGEESVINVLRINPAIDLNGKLSVIVLDFYQQKDGHTQQWVVTADWKEELPIISGYDVSVVQDNTLQFRLTEIAEVAGTLLQEFSQEETLTISSQEVFPFYPNNASNKVN